jgi:hypothetical protein
MLTLRVVFVHSDAVWYVLVPTSEIGAVVGADYLCRKPNWVTASRTTIDTRYDERTK